MAIEIVDFPIKNGGSFQFAMLNYQRVNLHFPMVFLSFSYDFPIFPWFSYGFPMVYQAGESFGVPIGEQLQQLRPRPSLRWLKRLSWVVAGASDIFNVVGSLVSNDDNYLYRL